MLCQPLNPLSLRKQRPKTENLSPYELSRLDEWQQPLLASESDRGRANGGARPSIAEFSGTSIQAALRGRDVAAAGLFRQRIPGKCKRPSPRAPTHAPELTTSTLAL